MARYGEDLPDRRSGVERRSGEDRRSGWAPASVPLEAYFERALADVERRVLVLERHDEQARERQGEFLTRERYDEGQQALGARFDERQRTLGAAVEALEKAAGEQQAIQRRRDMSRERLVVTVGACGAFTSAAITLALHALHVA